MNDSFVIDLERKITIETFEYVAKFNKFKIKFRYILLLVTIGIALFINFTFPELTNIQLLFFNFYLLPISFLLSYLLHKAIFSIRQIDNLENEIKGKLELYNFCKN